MSSLAALINAYTRRPTWRVYLDGQRWSGALSASISQELGQSISGGTLTGRAPPTTPAPGMAIRWSWGYNNFEVPGFTGYVTAPGVQSYPNVWSCQVKDAAWPAERQQGLVETSPLNNVMARAAIEQILAGAGVTRTNIPTINKPSDSGTEWELGTLTPISWSNTTRLKAAQDIAATAGYWLYADAGGTIRARQVERRPSDSPFRTFRRGVDLLLQGAPARQRPGDQVRNKVTVQGANTGVEGAQLWDTFLAEHILYPGEIQEEVRQYFLLEYIDDITATAERLTGLLNRAPNIVNARIKADPRLSVGMTIGIVDEAIGYASAQTFFIYRLQTDFDLRSGRFDQQLTLDGGIGDSGYSLNPPPVAVLSYTLERETVNGTAITIITVDGSGSYTQDEGAIVSYVFSTTATPFAGAATSPGPNTSSTYQFIVEDTESPVELSLTVTGTNSKTDTTSVSADLAGDGVTVPDTEALSVAAGAAWLITPDGGATWREQAVTTTLVPQHGAGVWDDAPAGAASTYGALGAGTTALRQTLDQLTSAPTTINTAGSNHTALHVNAKNASRVWRARGALVERSTDGGVTFASWGSPLPGSDVTCIIEDPALDNSVFAAAGDTIWHSLGDGAPGWLVLYAGPTGATARWFVRSEDGTITWVAYTGTFTGSPLQRIEGPIGVTFPAVSPAVSEIRALELSDTINPEAPRLLAIDQEARLWQIDGLTGLSVVQSAGALPAGSIAQHMVHSRRAAIAYISTFDSEAAGTGSVQKWAYLADAVLDFKPLASGQQAHMAGIVGKVRVSAFAVYMGIRDILDTSQNGVWKYAAGAWVRASSGLPIERMFVVDIQASPINPLQLIAVVHSNTNWQVINDGTKIVSNAEWALTSGVFSPWWYSGDGGASWQEIEINETLPAVVCNAFVTTWTPDGRWCISWHNPGAPYHNVAIRGTGTTPQGSAVTATGWAARWFAAGMAGDVVFLQRWPTGAINIYYLTSGGSYVVSPGTPGPYGIDAGVERAPTSREIAIGIDYLGSGSSGPILATPDYRAETPLLRTGSLTNIKTLTWSVYGLLPAEIGGAQLFSRIIDIYGSPSRELVRPDLFGSAPVHHTRADRQTRAIVGVRSNGERYFVFDGSSVVNIGYPQSSPSVYAIEVTA